MNNSFISFCCRFIFFLLFLFMSTMFVCSLFLTVNVNATQEASEVITFSFPPLVMSLGGIALFLVFHKWILCLLRKVSLFKSTAVLLILWAIIAASFIMATNLSQIYDYQYILEIGKLFGQSRFSSMHSDYLSAYPFQLGICFFIELLSRCFPSADIGLLLQLLNVFSCLISSFALCKTVFLLWGKDSERSCVVLCSASLPLILYCIFVYGTLYMMAVLTLIFLFFVLYQKTGKKHYLILCIFLFPVAYTFKLNAAVELIAFSICCLFVAVHQKNIFPVISALTAVILTLAIASAIPWQYKLRSGYAIHSTVSTKARFIMGFQDDGPAFGWHNRYIEKYFPLELSNEERLAMEEEDFSKLIKELLASPTKTARHLAEKIVTQWLEPSYGTIRYLKVCDSKGPYPFFSRQIADGTTSLAKIIQLILKLEQQILYLASAVCLASFRKNKDYLSLIFALTIGGGVLYHFLFEAKSSYAIVYMVFSTVFASNGFLIIERKLSQCLSSLIHLPIFLGISAEFKIAPEEL